MLRTILTLFVVLKSVRGDVRENDLGWHVSQGIQAANNGEELRAGSHFRRATLPSARFERNVLPESRSYSNLGVYFLRMSNYKLAARFLSLANLINPMGDLEEENWKALTKIRSKNYLCPWKGNAYMGVGLKEDLTQVAIRISSQGNDRLAFLYFAATCTGKIPSSLSCWTNLGVQLYRISAQIQAKIKKMNDGDLETKQRFIDKLNKLRSWAKYSFDSSTENKISDGNLRIYDFLNRTVSKAVKFKRRDLRLKLCRRSETYEKETEYFVEGMLMIHSGLYHVASYYLNLAWRESESRDLHIGVMYVVFECHSISYYHFTHVHSRIICITLLKSILNCTLSNATINLIRASCSNTQVRLRIVS